MRLVDPAWSTRPGTTAPASAPPQQQQQTTRAANDGSQLVDRLAGASRREPGVKPDPPGGEDTVLRSAIANVERATHQGGRRQHGAATSTGELAELGVAPRERSANPTNSVGLGNFGHRHRDPEPCP